MGLQRLIGSRYVLHDSMDQLIWRHRLGESLIRQHEPVAKYIGYQIRHVLGQDVGASAQERQRPRALDEIDRSARARAERYVLGQAGDTVAIWIPRSGGEPHRVLLERRVHIDAPALVLKHAQLFGRGHRDEMVGMPVPRATMTNSSSSVGYPTSTFIMNRSTCASGSGYVPSVSMGFWVAITRNGSGTRWLSPAIVTCRSCITSSNALCTFAGARLISSARRRLVKTGPNEVAKSPVFWL